MPSITTREQFAEVCLQRLGKPVIPIQLSAEQIDIGISDAMQYFRDYHFDATIRTFVKRQVGSSIITISTQNAASFRYSEKVISSITGTIFHVFDIPSANKVGAEEYVPALQVGEVITGQVSGATATVTAISQNNDVENGYISTPENIVSINRLLNFSNKTSNISMFDIRYQIRLNDLYSMVDSSMVYYAQVKQQLELMDQILIGQKGVRFNRIMNRCYIDMDWHNDVQTGDWLVFDGYFAVNPDEYTELYNDRVFQKLATAILKKQWGTNLSLYSEISLPGGLKLSGDKIYNDATRELEILEQEFQQKYEVPSMWYMG